MVHLSKRAFFKALAIPVACLAAGCSGADNPKIADAPTFTPPADAKVEPKGKPPGYGASDKYKAAMDRAANR